MRPLPSGVTEIVTVTIRLSPESVARREGLERGWLFRYLDASYDLAIERGYHHALALSWLRHRRREWLRDGPAYAFDRSLYA